jgi:hypothetical protein
MRSGGMNNNSLTELTPLGLDALYQIDSMSNLVDYQNTLILSRFDSDLYAEAIPKKINKRAREIA